MASLIPGYEYDIFISYRQKDNKYDGWVTEFVDNLKKELESMFKDEVSVYFDINPSDYLLESYDVDASLKDKLKCLVFIPIISRTYCDSKSYAWEYEFKAFVEQASHDQFGLKIKLPNGNVASRVLPIKIHDLDPDDIKLCESVLGGVLRGIEFIYKEPGVNRSLTPYDDEKKNLNNTRYRNQINKVALTIKEVISGLKTEPGEMGKRKIQGGELSEEIKKEERKEVQERSARLPKRKLLIGGISLAVLLLVIAAILVYPKIFKQDTLEKLRSSGERISVAVMPFKNMTNDTTWNVWQNGIQNELISSLTNFEELRVRQFESVSNVIQSEGVTNFTSLTPSVASKISQKLKARVSITGSIKQEGETIRVNAHLIDAKTEDTFKSFQIDGKAENIFDVTDSLSKIVKDYLIISILKKEVFHDIFISSSTNSPEALRKYLSGIDASLRQDNQGATILLSQAVSIDSNYTDAILVLAMALSSQGLYDQAKELCLKVYKNRDQLSLELKTLINWQHAIFFETPYEEIKYLKQLLELDDQRPQYYLSMGEAYRKINQYDKTIPEYQKALAIYKKWGIKPQYVGYYTLLGNSYHITGQYRKEKKLYKKAEQDFPDNSGIIRRQAILSLTFGDTILANRYFDKYKFNLKGSSTSDAGIAGNLAGIYYEADLFDKAEEYYRKALSLGPENPERLNALAYFLIDKERNVGEGMELINKALESRPDNYNYLHTKGWGLYKQGKYQEASEILQRSWVLRRQKATYGYATDAFQHLDSAKNAVAGQK